MWPQHNARSRNAVPRNILDLDFPRSLARPVEADVEDPSSRLRQRIVQVVFSFSQSPQMVVAEWHNQKTHNAVLFAALVSEVSIAGIISARKNPWPVKFVQDGNRLKAEPI